MQESFILFSFYNDTKYYTYSISHHSFELPELSLQNISIHSKECNVILKIMKLYLRLNFFVQKIRNYYSYTFLNNIKDPLFSIFHYCMEVHIFFNTLSFLVAEIYIDL